MATFRFQSTPSGGKATRATGATCGAASVSIHAFRGEGDLIRSPGLWGGGVSIHAFRGEGDATRPRQPVMFPVSIHAFRGEGDLWRRGRGLRISVFQSTPSGGKATCMPEILLCIWAPFQSTPSGGKATPLRHRNTLLRLVSIHAFRGEGDTGQLPQSEPCRVSIHAFRGEGDSRRQRSFYCWWCVSIHAFRGEGDPCKPPVRIQ